MKLLGIFIFVSLIFIPSSVLASGNVSISASISDIDATELTITYPVSGQSSLYILSSAENGPELEQFRTLKSAHGSDGSPRQITNNIPNQDAQVILQNNDTSVTVVYRLNNALKDNNVGLYAFPLIVDSSNGTKIDSKITTSDSIELLSYTGNLSTSKLDLKKVNSDYSIANIIILAYKKNGSYTKKDSGIFSIIAPNTRINRVYEDITNLNFINDVFKKIFGLSLPSKVNIAIVSLENSNLSKYEPEGLALPQGIILINPDTFAHYVPSLVSKKVLAHELTHLVTNSNTIFSNLPYNAAWLTEGLAVFAEQYITDNYLTKNNLSDKQKQPFAHGQSYNKLTRDELKNIYNLSFDFNFAINNKSQTIQNTYAHSGLIFYNLYLRDSSIIYKLLQDLRYLNPQPTCNSCDTNTVINKLTSLSNLSKDEIIYPFKNNLDSEDEILKILTTNSSSDNTADKSIVTSTEVDNNTQTNPTNKQTVESAETGSTEQTISTNNSNEVKESKSNVSFLKKIWLWFLGLFK